MVPAQRHHIDQRSTGIMCGVPRGLRQRGSQGAHASGFVHRQPQKRTSPLLWQYRRVGRYHDARTGRFAPDRSDDRPYIFAECVRVALGICMRREQQAGRYPSDDSSILPFRQPKQVADIVEIIAAHSERHQLRLCCHGRDLRALEILSAVQDLRRRCTGATHVHQRKTEPSCQQVRIASVSPHAPKRRTPYTLAQPRACCIGTPQGDIIGTSGRATGCLICQEREGDAGSDNAQRQNNRSGLRQRAERRPPRGRCAPIGNQVRHRQPRRRPAPASPPGGRAGCRTGSGSCPRPADHSRDRSRTMFRPRRPTDRCRGPPPLRRAWDR